MQVNITARHFKASERLKMFVGNEIKRLEKFYDGIIEGTVIMDYVNANHSKHLAEIHLKVYGQVLKVSEMTDDMYKSVDRAINKLERKLKKYKARVRGFTHQKAVDYVTEDNYLYEEE